MRLYSQLTGHWVDVDEECVLGAGGEGRVFGMSGAPTLAAKLFDDGGRPERDAKLRAMLANAPAPASPNGHSAIAWPHDLLSEAPGGPLIGYLMPRVRNGRVIDDYYNPQARLEQCPLFHYEYLLVVARNLAAAVRSLHQRGYVAGDIKQSNILVTPNALVTLVDTDSFQVYDERSRKVYRCPVGTPEYTPPELQGLTAPGLLKPEHDLFGLAVLIFQLLMEGAHPFAGVYTGEDDPPPLGDRIRMGWFPYDSGIAPGDSAATFRRQQELLARVPPPFVPARKTLPFSVLPPEIRYLFLRCFVEGRHDPERRPAAEEWQQALDRARTALVRCSANSQHRYGPHLSACPWCDRMRTVLRGNDPYPSSHEAARLNRPATAPLFAGAAYPPHAAPPMAWMPMTSSRRPSTKAQSGWAAYAVAALGIPVFLGLLSSQEVRDPAMPRFNFASEPRGTSSTDPFTDWGSRTMPPSPPEPPSSPTEPAQATSSPSAVLEALTPDGRYAAIMTNSTMASLLDCRTGRSMYFIEPSRGRASIDAIAVSPSGALMAAADRYGVALWDRVKSSPRSLMPNCGTVRSLAFSPSGEFIAAACEGGDGLVTLGDTSTGDIVRTYAGNYGEMVTTVRFSPDGKHVFASTVGSAEEATTLYCWDVASSAPMWRRSNRSWSTSFTVSPDSKTVTLGGRQMDMRTASNGDEIENGVATPDPIPDADPLCYTQDGRLLAIGHPTSVRLYHFSNGGSFSSTLPAVQVMAAAFSLDGAHLTTLSRMNGLEEWDIKRQHRIRRLAISTVFH
jgi:WD40 repeat protein